MITQDIPWKIGNGSIRVVIDDTDDWKVKVLSITSTTANEGFGRSQEITIKTTKGSPIKTKSFLVYQPGLLQYDGGIASTPKDEYKDTINCSTADSEFGTLDTDSIIDCGYSNNEIPPEDNELYP